MPACAGICMWSFYTTDMGLSSLSTLSTSTCWEVLSYPSEFFILSPALLNKLTIHGVLILSFCFLMSIENAVTNGDFFDYVFNFIVKEICKTYKN
jgi:hypothetical protein